VQLKLDGQQSVFTQHLMEMVYPHYLAPVPSMAVVELAADLKDSALAAGHRVPRDTALRSLTGRDERTACEYRTAHEVVLWPIKVTEAKYFDTPAAIAAAGVEIPSDGSVRAGLRLKFAVTAGAQASELALDALPVFIAGADELPKRLYEQLLGNAASVVVRTKDGGGTRETRLPAASIRPRGFDDDEAMIPYSGRSFSGYRLLQEYFACPERFLFAEFSGLRPALSRAQGSEFEIVVLFDRSVSRLHNAVDAGNFRLFCTPAINLFPRRADRIHL
jgi:type VI secretion system protein ImpG